MTLRMDWQQVVLNGGPPCFHMDHESPDRYCGRAQRWNGHDHDHKFVSLDDLLTTARKEAQRDFVNNIAAVLGADDVEAFTARVMKAKKSPDLDSETRSALKSEAEIRKEAREEAFRDAAQRLRDKAEDWRQQSARWQQKAESAGMDIIREQDYPDRDACLSKMAAAITLAIEFDEAAATTQKGENDD